MKQIRIQLSDGMAARLQRVAPAGSRKRSELIRSVLARVLQDLEAEQAVAEAYRRHPDTPQSIARERKFWEREFSRSRKQPRR